MRWMVVLAVFSSTAWANDFAFELGSSRQESFNGLPAVTFDGALEGRFSLAHGGRLDLRARLFGKPALLSRWDLPGFGHTALMRYRSPRYGEDAVAFSIAAGGGLFIWFGAAGGDLMAAWPGGAVEVSPTLDFKVSTAARFFIALNFGAGIVVNGWGFVSAGAALGFSFDLTKPRTATQPAIGPVP